jgi:hypothetical protein
MGSTTVLSLVANKINVAGPDDAFKAMSIAQFPPVPESPPEVLNQLTMRPMVQVFRAKHQGKGYCFVRYFRYNIFTYELIM